MKVPTLLVTKNSRILQDPSSILSGTCCKPAMFKYRQTPVYYTNTHQYGPFSGTTQVTRYQKGKTSLDFTEARDSEWQWHQLGHMQVCTSLQTDNHTGTPPLRFLQAGYPSCHPTNSVKALKAQTPVTNHIYSMTAASILEYVFITVTCREETVLTFLQSFCIRSIASAIRITAYQIPGLCMTSRSDFQDFPGQNHRTTGPGNFTNTIPELSRRHGNPVTGLTCCRSVQFTCCEQVVTT